MANYLKQENQLIVWPVLKEVTENDLFQGSIGLRARYDMTNKELLGSCLDAWKADKEKNYRLFLIRADGQVEISLNGTVKEAGIRNGDYLEIVVA
ncbi:hypothetical protein [Niallia endozanthoxylica]|uniref:MoaD/ThiS family protein n=1 Tax=Niallia endozanthoxylica TaxID=2036016 RepID=A0A5J5HZH4_9BACI|nr:hypothetical protein [Niallia endozanthoxylica]KAA9028522.1 hypothetical protein F4V44_04430 [Niallia endozanthoxylica]